MSLTAKKVHIQTTYELTYHIITWFCDNCESENSDVLSEEEDLANNHDASVICYKCKKSNVLKQSDIFKIK